MTVATGMTMPAPTTLGELLHFGYAASMREVTDEQLMQRYAKGDAEAFDLLYGDEEITSIATGTYKPIHLAPSVATVITAKEIEDRT